LQKINHEKNFKLFYNMKKILFVLCLFCAIQLTAQTAKEKEKFLSKIADSDQAIADPKKGIEPKTWVSRAELFTDIYDAPRKNLLPGIVLMQVKVALKEEKSKTDHVVIDGANYEVLQYPGRDLYFNEQGTLAFWDIKDIVVENPLLKAYEAYVKAAELDTKSSNAKKIKEGLKSVSSKMNVEATSAYNLQKYDLALTYFEGILACSKHPVIAIIDSTTTYNAGFVARLAGQNDKALHYFEEAIKIGYLQEGSAYANIASIFREQGNKSKAKDVLSKAFVQFPQNQFILTNLINLYLDDEEGGDLSEVLPYIQQAEENEPDNVSLYYAEGRVYQSLNNAEKTMECFNKAIEMDPNNPGYQYAIGAEFYNRGVKIQNQINDAPSLSDEEYTKMFNEMNAEYEKSLPYFTKAHELIPTNSEIIESLRSVYYRFRDKNPEMMEKYEYYKNLLDTM